MTRQIIIPIGTTASGKSTFINNSLLSHHVVSRDKIKEMFFGTTIEDGIMIRDNHSMDKSHNNTNTKKIYATILRNRMYKGDFIVLDETNCILSNVQNILNLCSCYQYEPFFIDFYIPLEEAINRNNNRKGTIGYVPENIIKEFYDKQKEVITYLKKKNYTVHNKSMFTNGDDVLDFINKSVETKLDKVRQTIKSYNNIYFVGDIQGCYDKLHDFLIHNYNSNSFFIFTGDYTDRGTQNRETLEFLFKFSKNKNTLFLAANHEQYVFQHLANPDKPTNHGQFNNVTRQEIEGINKGQLKAFYGKMLDYISFWYEGKFYFVTHGGTPPIIPDVRIPSSYYYRGMGEHCDNTALTLQNEDVIIVHGHRNEHKNPIRVGNVVNLEQKIEFGGELGYYKIGRE